MKVDVKPPERKKTDSPPLPSFSSLPDDIAVNCLARISRSYYPTLSIVCKSFHSLLSSTELYVERSRLGNTEQCLYVCLRDPSYQSPQWSKLCVNPNGTLPNSSVTKKKTIEQFLVPIPSSNFPSTSKCIEVVGSKIYLIGGPVNKAPSSSVRILDCRSHTWRDAPSMNVARVNAWTCAYDGKIYVFGGCKEDDEQWAEVFHTKTLTWEPLLDPGTEIRKCYISNIVEMEGNILFGNFLKMYAYDTKQSKWECCESESATFLKSECVIENILNYYHHYNCYWYAINDEKWKDVKGLESLRYKYKRSGGSNYSTKKLVSCGGKLLLIWEGNMQHNPNNMKKIWCAEIVLEKRHGGEVWGNVEWVGVVHTMPTSCQLLDCLVVSV